jgi:hypothetical protein
MIIRLAVQPLKSGLKVQSINGEMIPNWDDGPAIRLTTFFNEWGVKGWELVSYTEGEVAFAFKRPLVEHDSAPTTRLPEYPGP